jgi:hypothetical protein
MPGEPFAERDHAARLHRDAARAALLAYLGARYVRRDDPRYRILDRASEELVTFPVAGSPPPPATVRATGRLHTLHYDDAGNVVSGAPDFEGER